ncbi:MAG: crossover junction endodeoxyribonuclease RuvC [Kofleriaceae bacterium]|nr:crossover junction endodeoxyribonuclease RuvC [Kofleriaceae bacterium]MCB9573264.1 crossover junction endodeoxyribonuclease RuvC [Kofleriaceae bacterium]
MRIGPRRVLGIDPGSRICGYGLVTVAAGQLTYVECGVLTAPADWAMERRLGEIARSLGEVLDELRPHEVAIEDVFSRINARSALALAQARGMALAVVGLAALPVASYPAPVVKKAVVGRGRAEKDQVARMVQALLGLGAAPRADAADALAVAITHARAAATDGAARVVPAVVSPRP